jgi:glutaconate CoA-transferase subunit A
MDSNSNKLMTIKEAVSKFVRDGDMLVTANFLQGTPYAQIHEVIRQNKKDLTLVSCSAVEEVDQLLSGDCVSKIIISYYHRAGSKAYQRELDRRLRKKLVEYEDYSNFTMVAMLMAGALGYSFMPVLDSIKHSDIYNIRTFLGENKFKTIKCPFTSKETIVVPALNPDVALVHVQRADKYGNAQFWGSLGTLKWSALAAKKIIISCEEIVDHEIIKRSPFLTIIPGFRVNAVCKTPMGAHPSPLAGYYNHDINYRSFYFASNFSATANTQFVKEWIYDRTDRKDYMDHYIERFGKEPLEILKVNEYLSDQINMGYKQKYWQDGFCTKLTQTMEEYLDKVEKYGELEL